MRIAFATSPFPVVVAVENHCSLEQQRVVAKLLKEGFGEALYVLPPDTKTLPSPEELQSRIVLKV